MMLMGMVPPFIATFFIALFILTMQFLWVYIDELVGKGVGMLIILELLFYLLLSFFPLAFPIAILLSSVMVVGGYAERYELSSITSAGIPLSRAMRSLILFAIGIGVLSFVFSNYLVPIANLKYKSRLIDIRNQRPTLSIQQGVFNYDFPGVVMRIGKKAPDDKKVSDVMIYENRTQNEKINLLIAPNGEMYTDNARNLFILNLDNGSQYQQLNSGQSAGQGKYPFVRTNFKTYSKQLDLSQFDFNRSDESLYKTHQSMLSVRQLHVAADSIHQRILLGNKDMLNRIMEPLQRKISVIRDESIELRRKERINKELRQIEADREMTGLESFHKARLQNIGKKQDAPVVNDQKNDAYLPGSVLISTILKKPAPSNTSYFTDILQSRFIGPVTMNATRDLRSSSNTIILQSGLYESDYKAEQKHYYELHLKFAYALMCIVFLFVGAPMGAIVRKGGFGYPLLVAIIFYMIFQILATSMKKSVDSLVITGSMAAWVPVIVLAIIGILLTRSAMLDKMINLDRIMATLQKIGTSIFDRLRKSRPTPINK